jgi:hypothetical protein
LSQGLTYAVDLVLCIDATGSMAPVIEQVKKRALEFPSDLITGMGRLSKKVTRLRLRVIAFRDVGHDSEPFQVSDFFELPGQAVQFQGFVSAIAADGGGDEPESALEAIALAVHSDWASDSDKQRHAIVVFTDASGHRLEETAGSVPRPYAELMPGSLDELTELWEGDQGRSVRLRQSAKRIVVFAPEAYPWTEISLNWHESIHFPSKAGDGLADHEYSEILEMLAKSV